MSDAELLFLIAGFISGIVIVGVLVTINQRMKAGEAPRRAIHS